jgi:hypothetical protein
MKRLGTTHTGPGKLPKKKTIRFTQEHNGGAGALSQGPKMFFLPLQDLFPAA